MGGCCGKSVEASAASVSKQQQEDATGGLSEAYEVKHLLGSGCSGDTWLCKDRATSELVAVKLMKRPIPQLMGTSIIREVKIGAALGKGHLNIVKPREVILTRTHLGLVMEYVAGGNMADYILKTILLKFGGFDTRDGLVMEEDEARYFFSQIMSSVQYCHDNRVAHRDLKMDNTLLDDHDPPRIKICDFGFAKWWADVPQMSTITGTPDYMSPQLLGPKAQNTQALYDATKADIWASGVLLCVMLIGRFPFEGTEMNTATHMDDVSSCVYQQQTSAQRWYDNPLIQADCQLLSCECVDLLSRIFENDEDKRITLDGIKAHPWYSKPLSPLYQRAMDQMCREQEQINMQVKAGAYVNKDRDSALKQMIYLAATTHNEILDAAPQAGPDGLCRASNQGLRKISLTAIKPYQYELPDLPQEDLKTISNFFSGGFAEGTGSQESTEHDGGVAAHALAEANGGGGAVAGGGGGGGVAEGGRGSVMDSAGVVTTCSGVHQHAPAGPGAVQPPPVAPGVQVA